MGPLPGVSGIHAQREGMSQRADFEESKGEFEDEIQTNVDVKIRSSMSSGLWYNKNIYLVFVVPGTEFLIP